MKARMDIMHARFRLASALKLLVPAVGLLLVLMPQAATAQQGGDAVRQFMEQTAELLEWAGGLVHETDSDPARTVLRQAFELHKLSEDLFERGRLAEAMGVARRARDAVWHAVRVAREASGLDERLRLRAERFQDEHRNLTERATEARNRQALEFLERARNQAERARDIHRQGDLKLAWNILETAGDLMQRAARLLADSGGPERLEAELERTRELIERAGERLGTGAAPARRQLLVEAEEALQRAYAARDDGNPGRALQLAGLAQGLVRRAADGVNGSGPGDEAVSRQLERFAARAEIIGERVAGSSATAARRLYDRALQQRDRAVEAEQSGDRELALRLIRAAHDLLNQAEKILD